MQTKKEALLARMRGEKTEYVFDIMSGHRQVVFPGERFEDFANFDPYGTGPDWWGVMWTNMGPNPAIDGNTVAKDFRLFENMEEWKEKVKFPDLDLMPMELILNKLNTVFGVNEETRKTEAISCLLLSGQFERLNQMIGMENALCAFYEYPDEVHEFFDAMCEYKLKCIDLAYKYVKPDIIHMHDDWGTNNNMFFSPDIWREFIKPNEKRYVERIHEYGMLYMHHSCGYIQQIIPDLVEIGVDAINPVMVQNDVDYILENYGDKITVVGGLDNQLMETPGTTAEEIQTEIRTRMDRYMNRGRYIPYFVPNNQRVYGIYSDVVNSYGREINIL